MRIDLNQFYYRHVLNIASHVRSRSPKTKILFWDDMMRGMPDALLRKYVTPSEKHAFLYNYSQIISIDLFRKVNLSNSK